MRGLITFVCVSTNARWRQSLPFASEIHPVRSINKKLVVLIEKILYIDPEAHCIQLSVSVCRVTPNLGPMHGV